jgi:ABC-type glycerol-3-phosphate transport system substrate-binding protein
LNVELEQRDEMKSAMMKIRKRMTTVISKTVALMILMGFLVNVGHAQEKGKSAGYEAVAQLYASAKKEGTVVIWGPTDAVIYQRAQAVLDKQYPGIKIEHFESIPEPLVQRIIAENQAGKPAAVDIIQSGSLRALRPLIDRDMLAAYPGWKKDFGLDSEIVRSFLCLRLNHRCRLLSCLGAAVHVALRQCQEHGR